MRNFLLALMWVLFAGSVSADILLQQPDGTQLALSQPAKSIVTLSPHLAELVYAAGAGTRMVATVEYSDYPAETVQLKRVGDAFRIDVEQVVFMKPDLVIAWDTGNPRSAVEQLRALGIPLWSVEIRHPEEISGILTAIGQATGLHDAAGAAASQFSNRLEQLRSDYSGRQEVRYFYQIADRPLFTINDTHLISQGLKLCGGSNIFANEPGLAFQVSHESVIVANPDVLFAPHNDSGDNPLESWREWPGLNAVEHHALFLLPADKISRATPRWLEAIEIACRLMDDLPQRRNHE